MERNFQRPKVGDEYRVSKRYDTGGWPVIRVLAVDGRRHVMTVQDCFTDGTLQGLTRDPRPFGDDKRWSRLRKCWVRHVRPACAAWWPWVELDRDRERRRKPAQL